MVKYEGYVSPGVLLLTSDPCSMEVIRGAWCRNVLRPPNSYVITKIGKTTSSLVPHDNAASLLLCTWELRQQKPRRKYAFIKYDTEKKFVFTKFAFK